MAMGTARILLPLLLALLAHSPRSADGFAASTSHVDGRRAEQRFKRELSFEKLGEKIHSFFSSLPPLDKPLLGDMGKLEERFGSLGHGVVAHEEVTGGTGSKGHRTAGAYFLDSKGGLSGITCYDEKCKKEQLKERRRRSAAEHNDFPSGKTLQADILSNVLNTLEALSQRLEELQHRLAQSLQNAATYHPTGLPDSSSSHFSGAAAGGSAIAAGGGSPIHGEFVGSSISSSTSPGVGTVVSHKEVIDRVGSPTHTASGTYLVDPHGEVSGVSCTDGKCHKVGEKGGGAASGPSQAGGSVPLGERGGSPSSNKADSHYSSSSFLVDRLGHVSGVACVDGKCKSTGDDKKS